ncbi:hypothetical protein OLJ77_004157 [Escherichia coli]|nr:hypothetical protein [Escherichia coli]
MTLPYGVISDCHYHKWDAFSTTNAEGLIRDAIDAKFEITTTWMYCADPD